MMRVLPDCPACGEPDLRLIRDAKWIAVRCLECNWSYTWLVPPPEDELDAAIVAVVGAWRDVAQAAQDAPIATQIES